jgi:hypothetical protein
MKYAPALSLMLLTLACWFGPADSACASVGTANVGVTILSAGGVSQIGSVPIDSVPMSGLTAAPVVSFSATSNGHATTAILLPSEVTVTRAGGSETLQIDRFAPTVDAAGIGANIHVGALQAPGVYVGTAAIGIAFN